MRKFGHDGIQSIIRRACKEFLEDDSSPDSVSFFYNGHWVNAYFHWSKEKCSWYLSHFDIAYSRCVMHYYAVFDYDLCSAWCW